MDFFDIIPELRHHQSLQKVVVASIEADKRELRVKNSAPNDNLKIGYYSIFLLSNDRKRSYESIGMVIYWYRSVVKKWLTPLQKVPRFNPKLHGLTVHQLSVFFCFFYFFIFFAKGKENSVLDFSRGYSFAFCLSFFFLSFRYVFHTALPRRAYLHTDTRWLPKRLIKT